MVEVRSEWVNEVLRTTVRCEPRNPHVQLSILTRALVLAAKSVGADCDVVVANLQETWKTEQPAVRAQ